jgi:hypothetical protein
VWFECPCGLEYGAWNDQQGPKEEEAWRCWRCHWAPVRWAMDKLGTGSASGYSYRLRGWWPPERRRRRKYLERAWATIRAKQSRKA